MGPLLPLLLIKRLSCRRPPRVDAPLTDLIEAAGVCPLHTVRYSVVVSRRIADVTVEQFFTNDRDFPVEVDYELPKDVNSAVVELEFEVDGRKMQGRQKSKEEAEDDFDDAVAQGLPAVLAQGSDGLDDILRFRLGVLGPNKKVTASIRYLVELLPEPGTPSKARFVVPLSIMERYLPTVAKSESDAEQAAPTYDISLLVRRAGEEGEQLKLTSPSHPEAIEAEGYRKVEVVKDFIVDVEASGADDMGKGRATGCSTAPDKFHYALAIPFSVPEAARERLQSLRHTPEIIFLLDCSGSMRGERIRECERVAKYALASLPPGCLFNVVRFGTTSKSVFTSYNSQPLTEATFEKAKAYVRGLQADLRGTNLLTPLKMVSRERGSNPPRTKCILVITDGAVLNTAEVLKEVASKSEVGVKVFSVGLGPDCSKHLVEGLARHSGGRCMYVSHGENLTARVMEFLKQMLQPSLMGCEVISSVCTALPPLYGLFQGETRVIRAFAPKSAAGIPDGTTLGQKCQFEDSSGTLHTLEHRADGTLQHLAGKRIVTASREQPVLCLAHLSLPASTCREVGRFLSDAGFPHDLAAPVLSKGKQLLFFSTGRLVTPTSQQQRKPSQKVKPGATKGGEGKAVARVQSINVDFDRLTLQVNAEKDGQAVYEVMNVGVLKAAVAAARAAQVRCNVSIDLPQPLMHVRFCSTAGMHSIPLGAGVRYATDTPTPGNDHLLAAWKQLQALQNQRQLGRKVDTQEAVTLATSFNIMSPFTSCVAVDEEGEATAPAVSGPVRRQIFGVKKAKAKPQMQLAAKKRCRVTSSRRVVATVGDISNDLDEMFLESCTKLDQRSERDRERATSDDIIMMQAFDGSWSVTPPLAAALRTTVDRLKEEAKSRSLPETAWATAYTAAFLALHFEKKKDEWELLHAKALAYLSGLGFPDLVDAATQVLSGTA